MVEQRTQILANFKRKSTVPILISTVLSAFVELYVLFGVQFYPYYKTAYLLYL